MDSKDLLAEDMGRLYLDPLGFVMHAFPWNEDETIRQVKLPEKYQVKYGVEYGPDQWAIDFLERLQAEMLKGEYPLQFSTASGHGIGKTTLVAWLILWIMSTRPLANGVVTANTIEQLRSKTWSELSKWLNLCVTKDWFAFSSGRGNLVIRHIEHPETWKCQAQTAKEENSEAFAGLHAASSTPFYIFDEASAVPDKIFEVREGGTTDGEAMTFDFGNPTRNSGMFFENTVGRFSHNYIKTFVDSRDVSITNKKRIDQWIEDRGEDSDFVKVRVRGVFPSIGSQQFIAMDRVEESMKKQELDQKDAPLVLGVDVARFGQDDTVIYPRMGLDARSWEPTVISGQDTTFVTGKVIEIYHSFQHVNKTPVMIFVDANGVGAGVYDQLKNMQYPVVSVFAQHQPLDKNQYKTKTDEMWGEMRDAIYNGLVLPPRNTDIGSQLFSQLTQREYDYTLKGQISLESKSDMKDRGVESPDIADALALTYYYKVQTSQPFARKQHLSYTTERSTHPQPTIINGRYS